MPDETQHPSPGFTPTGYKRTQGGSVKWVPPTVEHLGKLLPQYDIESLLGRGGMCAVYRARQKSLDRLVAIKILPPDVVDEEMNFAERFKNEARTMAKMNHPAIVHVYGYGETTEGQPYIVMEYIDGTDVARMISSQTRLPSEHALAITAHVCDALQYAHTHGVIHRDIKPANILIDMEGAVKVADFGLAKAMDAGQSGLTQTTMAVGTPDYVAPEALMSGIAVDGRADLYAVSVMLYAMLTGNVPRGSFPLPSKTVSTDPRFDKIILKAMEMDREKHYQTAYDIRKDLDVILTTPHVEAGGQSSAAVPKHAAAASAKAQTPLAQKPIAKAPQKRIEGSTSTPARNQMPGGAAGKMNEAEKLRSPEGNLRAPLPEAKSLSLADREWSIAAGIGRDEKWKADTTPSTVFRDETGFGWEHRRPLSQPVGNYSDLSRKEKAPIPSAGYIDRYDDGFPTTAPVMSFKPNKLGLYDLSGNVWEWVEDWHSSSHERRALRGSAWTHHGVNFLRASVRYTHLPTARNYDNGFRIVLETTD